MYEVDWEKLYEGCTGTLGTIFKILTINLKLFQDKKLIKKEQNKAKPMLICLFKKQKNKTWHARMCKSRFVKFPKQAGN